MDNKKQIGNTLLAILLFSIFAMPIVVQFSHVFEEHQHVSCSDKTTHIHKSITECEVCDFNLTSFNYDFTQYPDLSVPQISVKVVSNFNSSQFHSFQITNTQLRAPPIFS